MTTENMSEFTIEDNITIEEEVSPVETIALYTIDDIVRNIAVEVVDEAIKAIPECQVEEVDYASIESQVEETARNTIEDAFNGFEPYEWAYASPSDFVSTSDYDPDEWVTDEAFGSFREEIESALENLDGAENFGERLEAIESRLDSIEEAIRNFGQNI